MQEHRARERWIDFKQECMDERGEMARDLPGVWEGQSRTYGLYDGNSVRTMTAQEVEWNGQMVRRETNNRDRFGPDPHIESWIRKQWEERDQRAAERREASMRRQEEAVEQRRAHSRQRQLQREASRRRQPAATAQRDARFHDNGGPIPRDARGTPLEDDEGPGARTPPPPVVQAGMEWLAGAVRDGTIQQRTQTTSPIPPRGRPPASSSSSVHDDDATDPRHRSRSREPLPLPATLLSPVAERSNERGTSSWEARGEEEADEQSPAAEGDGGDEEDYPDGGEDDGPPWDEGDGFAGPPDWMRCGDLARWRRTASGDWVPRDEYAGDGDEEQDDEDEGSDGGDDHDGQEAQQAAAAPTSGPASAGTAPTSAGSAPVGLQAAARAPAPWPAPPDADQRARMRSGASQRAPVTPPLDTKQKEAPPEEDDWQRKCPWNKKETNKRAQQHPPSSSPRPATAKCRTPEPRDQLRVPAAAAASRNHPQSASAGAAAASRTPSQHRGGTPAEGQPPPAAKRRPRSRAPVQEAASSSAGAYVDQPPAIPERLPAPRPTRAPELQGDADTPLDRQLDVRVERRCHAGARATTVSAGDRAHDEETARNRKNKNSLAVNPAVATARTEQLLLEESQRYKTIIKLPRDVADIVEKSKPSRPPPLVLAFPHEACQALHMDWTVVEGASWDPKKRALEMRHREERNQMIFESLTKHRPVFYPSTGDSMWPLVQSEDFCSFHPIQAVTAEQGTGIFTKEASTIDVGDVVFCAPQPSNCFYAHLVLKKEWRRESGQYCYEIGNISGHVNGWCHREHIFGILAHVQKFAYNRYYSRPLPREIFAQVKPRIDMNRWCKNAEALCEPDYSD